MTNFIILEDVLGGEPQKMGHIPFIGMDTHEEV